MATKEDIEDITKKVEGIKSEYNAQTERLKVELSKDLHIHQIQFEKEFEVYVEIWEKLMEWEFSINALHTLTVFGSEAKNVNNEEEIRDLVEVQYWQFIDLVRKRRPFYSGEIYNKLAQLTKLIVKNTDLFSWNDKPQITREDLKNIKNNYKKISEAINSICDEIRKRIFERYNN